MLMSLLCYSDRKLIWTSLTVLWGLILWASHSVVLANEGPALIAYPAHVSHLNSDLTLEIISPAQSWNIQLQKKSLLGSLSSVQSALYEIPEFFNGFVIGKSNSWVRLTRNSASSALTGYLFINRTLYELKYREDIDGHTVARLADSDSQLLGNTETITATNNLTISSRSVASNAIPPAKAIRVGIVVDSRYNEQQNNRGLAHALGVMNGVDGLYQNQLGLAVVVESFRVYDNPDTDPLREITGTADELLENYRHVRMRDTELSKDLALVHLFSGLRDPQKVIGLGWISTACSVNGYDLSLSTPFPFDVLLAAHEIGHNLGATHDDDARCLTDENITGVEVMWSQLSGNTRPTFSACSLQPLRQTINSGGCVADNIDVSVTLNATPTAIIDQRTIQITVLNQDASRPANQVNSLTTFPLGTALSDASADCSIQGSTLACQHGPIDMQGQSALSANAVFIGTDNPVITTELDIDLFIDTRHQDNRAAIQLDNTGTVAGGSMAANPPSLSASGNSAPVNNNGALDQPANDQSPTGAGAGLKAGSASALMLLMLSLYTLLAFGRQRHTQVVVCAPVFAQKTDTQKLRSTE